MMQALGRPAPHITRAPAAVAGAPAAPALFRYSHLRRRRGASSSSRAAAATASAAAPRLVDARLRADPNGLFAYYAEIELATQQGISLHDLTSLVKQAVKDSGVSDGSLAIASQHTTLAVTINEFEPRLVDDCRLFLRRLVPASDPWLHNDLHLRHAPEGWPGGDEGWRAQEPENAQAHVQAVLVGCTAAVPVSGGELKIGQWQSVIGVELDGPRTRRYGVSVTGLRAP
jgi:secondary thiamine-phosphate synthase enzyme